MSGLTGLTMRATADELGVKPMAGSRRVASKRDG